jgi:hypothetical protein
MNLQEIEQNVANLDPTGGFEFIYDLLRAYGVPKASISRLRSGVHDRSKGDDEVLWKGRLYYRYLTDGEDPHVAIDDASKDESIIRQRPRFLVVRNSERLLAIDTRVETTLDIDAKELSANSAFFLPWAGIEKTQLEMTNYADIKAAEKMARLYDEVVKHNELSTSEQVHDLNVFFSRLLFCFFAEDTGVFPKGSFTNALASLTAESGEDTAGFLDALFDVLNLPENNRDGVSSHFLEFGYVNGKLFARRSPAPTFSARARKLILECGTLNWSQINPDIFGSMIQAVVHPSQREGLGMHYTSIENILKVIRPLFLDDLHQGYDRAQDDVQQLEKLLWRIGSIRVFDPACGSGNFLVIAYKELRRLEHRILQRLQELAPTKSRMFSSTIKLENFFGIEIDDFAHEIAILSLWLAKHQMNVEFRELFGVDIPLIPLRDTGHIHCGNAIRIDWMDVCPRVDGVETYVLGNPPYLGSTMQTAEQKRDFVRFFGSNRYPKNLDYISLWFLKGANYISDGTADLAFVSTNSVCQGDHVGLMWPQILEQGIEIAFAHTSFPWSNLARGKAAVICIVVGLSRNPSSPRRLYSGIGRQDVSNINPYLAPTDRNTIVTRRASSLFRMPEMLGGNKPSDGGNLVLTPDEATDLLEAYPAAKQFIKNYVGAQEFLKGLVRYCIWIPDEHLETALTIPPIRARLDRVAAYRQQSTEPSTQKMAAHPNRFYFSCYQDAPCLIVPGTTSERRDYIPVGLVPTGTVVSNLANVVYTAEPWLLGLIQSRMHMVWMRAVAGRMKSDYRYSPNLVYNTFPVPPLGDLDREALTRRVLTILEAREQFSDQTMAQLYDPDLMPPTLRRAHEGLDEAVDSLYARSAFASDEERLDVLFKMYEEATSEGSVLARA